MSTPRTPRLRSADARARLADDGAHRRCVRCCCDRACLSVPVRADLGKKVFETISITLVCDECLKTDHPEKCRHKLASMPRWLSSQKVEVVRKLLSEDPAMLLRESLGISADGSEKVTHYNPLSKRQLNVLPVDCGAGLPQLLHRVLHRPRRAADPLLRPQPGGQHAARLHRRRPLRRRRERLLGRHHRAGPQRVHQRAPARPPAPRPGRGRAAASSARRTRRATAPCPR